MSKRVANKKGKGSRNRSVANFIRNRKIALAMKGNKGPAPIVPTATARKIAPPAKVGFVQRVKRFFRGG